MWCHSNLWEFCSSLWPAWTLLVSFLAQLAPACYCSISVCTSYKAASSQFSSAPTASLVVPHCWTSLESQVSLQLSRKGHGCVVSSISWWSSLFFNYGWHHRLQMINVLRTQLRSQWSPVCPDSILQLLKVLLLMLVSKVRLHRSPH